MLSTINERSSCVAHAGQLQFVMQVLLVKMATNLNRFGFCFDVRFHQKYFVAMQDRFEGVVTNRNPPWRSRCSCHCPDESGQSSSSWVQNQIALNNQGNRWSEEPTIACSPPMLNMMEVRIACHGQQPAHGVDCPD